MTRTLRRVQFEQEFVRIEACERRPLAYLLVDVQTPYRAPTMWQAWSHAIAIGLFIAALVTGILWAGGTIRVGLP